MARKVHTPEQIINKLREAEILISQRATSFRSQQEDRSHGADLLSLVQRIWWHAYRVGEETQEPGERECPAEKLVADLSLDISILKEAARGNF